MAPPIYPYDLKSSISRIPLFLFTAGRLRSKLLAGRSSSWAPEFVDPFAHSLTRCIALTELSRFERTENSGSGSGWTGSGFREFAEPDADTNFPSGPRNFFPMRSDDFGMTGARLWGSEDGSSIDDHPWNLSKTLTRKSSWSTRIKKQNGQNCSPAILQRTADLWRHLLNFSSN